MDKRVYSIQATIIIDSERGVEDHEQAMQLLKDEVKGFGDQVLWFGEVSTLAVTAETSGYGNEQVRLLEEMHTGRYVVQHRTSERWDWTLEDPAHMVDALQLALKKAGWIEPEATQDANCTWVIDAYSHSGVTININTKTLEAVCHASNEGRSRIRHISFTPWLLTPEEVAERILGSVNA